jgi:hypothetical protein
MTKFCKLINYVILATLFLICIAFGFFLKTNWNFILNPELVPGYVEGQSTFQYAREDLAYYRNWCYHYPMTIIPYLIYIESILLAHLIFKKNLLLTKLQLFTIVLFLLFIIFSDYIFDNLLELFNSNNLRQIGYRFNDFLDASFYIAFLFLLIGSPILMFFAKFKSYRTLLILNISTILMYLIFIYAYMELFFD